MRKLNILLKTITCIAMGAAAPALAQNLVPEGDFEQGGALWTRLVAAIGDL